MRRALSFVLVVAALAGIAACGEGTEQRVANERADAAEQARIQERVENLEGDLQDARRSARSAERRARDAQRKAEEAGGTTVVAPSAPSGNTSSGGADGGDWPGGSGYTAVIASETSADEARRVQTQATARGLDAGVLYSTNFSSLRPGYWVVFSGTFPDQSDAARRAGRAKELGYGSAYPRFIAP